MSAEDSILNGLVPAADFIHATANAVAANPACFDHGRPNCAECADRIKRAQEVAAARLKQSAQPSEAFPEALQSQPSTVPTKTTTEPEVVTLARTLTDLQERLQREEKLLVCAVERVAFLKESIANLKTAAEDARQRLVEYVTPKN